MGNAGRFVKGDKRINRRGRPKSFDKLRELARQIAHEELINKDGSHTGMSVIEAILRNLAAGDTRSKQLFVEVAYGKVPDEVAISGGMELRPMIYLPAVDENPPREESGE